MNKQSIAVVLLSGGLDSATCLALAANDGYTCHVMSFDYGQRSRSELDAATRVAKAANVAEHRIITLDMAAISGSALTDTSIPIPEQQTKGIPATYVPARNTVFLAHALAWAEVLAADAIYIGVNAVDYSGYPDCRPEYISAWQQLINLATKASVEEGKQIQLTTPLINLPKAEIIALGTKLGVDYSLTISCYQADKEGRACNRCDSCRLRKQGFTDAGMDDPTRYY
ncbi:MAG: 7-cyano-7-deazaguanine synthase QueC [Pseudohongiellaceae bacterium]